MKQTNVGLEDLIDIGRMLKKHRKLIIGTFIGFTVCAAVISYNIPPTYEAVTTLRVKPPNELANPLAGDNMSMRVIDTGARIATYSEILKSAEVIQEVIEKTQANKEKVPNYDEMVGRISTQQVNNTEIFRVKVNAKSAEEAQLVANTLAESFNNRLTELARTEQTIGRKFIGDLLNESKGELEKAETALQQYKSVNKITDAETETKVLAEARSSINKLVEENAVNRAAAQAKVAASKQQLADENPGFIADNPSIQQYKTKLADLEMQLVGLTQKYTSFHPEVIATRMAIQEAQKKLNLEIARVINAEAPSMNTIHQGLLQERIAAEIEMDIASAQKEAIDSIAQQSEQELGKLPVKERGLAKVLRDAEVSREIYIMLAKRYEEARISEVMQPTDLQVISSATLPDRPISPNNTRNIFIGAIAGFLSGIGLALLSEHLNKSISTAADIKRFTSIPLLGSIPDFDEKYEAPKANMWHKLKQTVFMQSWRGS